MKKQARPHSAHKPTTSLALDQASSSSKLHPRNRHLGRYDFAALKQADAALIKFIITNEQGEQSIDFANAQAVMALNRALLLAHYGVVGWNIPADHLCPPVPGRADYVHYLADLLASCNNGKQPKRNAIHALDIGTGTSCIYPLIGSSEYQWNFVASDISPTSLANAQKILDANPKLANKICLRLQTSAKSIFKNIVHDDEWFDVSMCNPPFHTSLLEAQEGAKRKWHNLGKTDLSTQDASGKVHFNFGGQDAELWCAGGELAFIQSIVKESALIPTRCFWFSTLVSKSANLPDIEAALKRANVQEKKIVVMNQGQKQSRLVAWTFLNKNQQEAWRKLRW